MRRFTVGCALARNGIGLINVARLVDVARKRSTYSSAIEQYALVAYSLGNAQDAGTF